MKNWSFLTRQGWHISENIYPFKSLIFYPTLHWKGKEEQYFLFGLYWTLQYLFFKGLSTYNLPIIL